MSTNVKAQSSAINPDVAAAIAALVGEGSKIEYGYLNIIANKNIGVFPAVDVPQSMVTGDQLWVRKNGIQIGGSRSTVVSNTFYSDNVNQVVKIPLTNEFWVRFEIDVNAINSIGQTFTGQQLKDQLESLLFFGLKLCNNAKFDAVAIDTLNKGIDQRKYPNNPDAAKVVYFDYDSMFTSTDALDKVINTYVSINRTLSEIESSIGTFHLGSNNDDYKAVVTPFIANLTQLYKSRYAGSVSENENNIGANSMFGIEWLKHPFFHKVANVATSNINNIDRSKTVFDIDTTYDFSELLGLITHNQAAIVPIKFMLLNAQPDPTTGNLIVVSRIGWGAEIIRPGLFIKIINGSPANNIYLSEIEKLAIYLNNPANAIITASGTTLTTALLAAIKAYSGGGSAANFSAATITSTLPVNAATVTAPTLASAIISVPAVADTGAVSQSGINISFYYKNS